MRVWLTAHAVRRAHCARERRFQIAVAWRRSKEARLCRRRQALEHTRKWVLDSRWRPLPSLCFAWNGVCVDYECSNDECIKIFAPLLLY
jgi:hypothetical protein